MNRYYIGCYLYSTHERPFDENEWIRQWEPEMFQWIKENVGNKFRLCVEAGELTCDEWETANIYVIYDLDRHAVLHKLRWA